MKILILGCGPAGMIAAHAAVKRGHDVSIASKPRKSRMNGAQYLHAPIPDANKKPSFVINYQLAGEVAGYRDKVYGPMSNVEVSPESLVGQHPAWDIREAYDWLWDEYKQLVTVWDASPDRLLSRMRSERPDQVISTVPAPLLCARKHAFESASIWATEFAHGEIRDNTVLCQGSPQFGWYRSSRIQGHQNTEWPLLYRPTPDQAMSRIWEVTKPIKTDCTCFPAVHRMGRYGKWKKGVLSHEAWTDTNDLLDRIEHGGNTQ